MKQETGSGMRSLEQAVKEHAAALGFDACGITAGEPPASGDRLAAWLEAGRHGGMGWMARNADKRRNLDRVLPGVRSVISLAMSYAPVEGASRRQGKLKGVIARYARFQDYHDVVAERVREICTRLDAMAGPERPSLAYVDTGPVLERDLAQRAGLGFIGKHTNLISRGLGNWFFLAEILTQVGMHPDSPERNRCGKCTQCLTACPTEAIIAPFQLDARRCISYLTIEHRGFIPEALRPAIGDRIFGCDDCLEVCPWNRFARAGRMMADYRRPDLEYPALLEFLDFDEAGFRNRFRGTPLFRTGRRRLVRNVCVALGNVATPAVIPRLREVIVRENATIGEHARWAIREIGRRHNAGAEPR